jgi:type IV pilus assembly protein PilY1
MTNITREKYKKLSHIKCNQFLRYEQGEVFMRIKNLYKRVIFLTAFLISLSALSEAQVMSDYTAYPPSVVTNTKPNLMLMIDNSASMYDLAYIDNGNAPVRESSYCYDQTYSSNNTYVGYFDQNSVYTYDFGSSRFETGGFPGSCSHQISNELCVNIVSGSPSTVTEFTARGNYLNWLTASKFDVQKKILTGGKYDTATNQFISESRGCVGRGFIKEALTTDYVEGGLNTSLGLAFSIGGEPNKYNPSGVSKGGQTYIKVYEGNYDEVLCQSAIEQINYGSNPSAIRTTVEDCLSYDPQAGPGTQYCLLDPGRTCSVDSDCDNVALPGDCSTGNPSSRKCLSPASMAGQSCVNDADCNTVLSTVGPCVGGTTHSADVTSKIVFNQAMQECWQIWSGSKATIGTDAWAAEAPKCADLYANYKICNGGDNDGLTCTSDVDCTGGGTCINGPNALRPGNAGLLCNSKYTGQCASTGDNWATTNWVAPAPFADPEDCFLSKYLEFCNDVKLPPVIDPSDAPDDTSVTANIPAIIADIGVEAQLGSPIAEFKANKYDTTAPTGLINEYADVIRFGAMSFNFDGSDYECNLSAADGLDCPKVCSTTSDLSCNTDLDCPSGETCNSAVGSKDAGKVIGYIGDAIGDHDSGLINDIDTIRAITWTPFAETYYNAIAYFVKDAIDNPDLDPAKFTPAGDAIQDPLNFDDFTGNKNPIEFYCQNNNILIISDGSSTTDLDLTMQSKVNDFSHLFDDGDASDPASCGNYSGSTYLDDLSYYAKNRNIFDPSDADPDDDEAAQRITTYVVYTGSDESTETGECAPKTLMENTAQNGGTTLFNPKDPEELQAMLKRAFLQISSDVASGSSASVLSSSTTGEGAVYHAQYYPKKRENLEYRSWLGVMQSLFIDSYGNLREDSDNDDTLDSSDSILKMKYTIEDGTRIAKCSDTTGDGKGDSCTDYLFTYEDINPVWSGGKLLWERDLPANPRDIFTTVDGHSKEQFVAANFAALKPYLREEDDDIAATVIDWIRGKDPIPPADIDASHPNGYRKRDITGTDSNGVVQTYIWKLGDIVHSAPTLVGRPMENYDLLYGDMSYSKFWLAHKNRLQVAYIGANDGMLHAFNAGCFDAPGKRFYSDVNGSGACFDGTHTLGEELWAFIPRGLLPHLQWLTDPAYTHVYYVDAKPKVSDVKIFDADATNVEGWGSILIGSLRLGGKDIVWTHDTTKYSASPEYFALDVTDPLNPRLLWTFSNPDLGLSMSYPSVVKIGTSWYAIFGSGATDFDEESNFTSYQNGNIFVLKISGGNDGVINLWTENTNFWKLPTGGINTYLADPITIDVDMNFDVDVMYIGENDPQNDNAFLHRLTTLKGTQNDPSLWQLSTLANISTIGGAKDAARRITAAPAAAMDNNANLWVYFGTGQFLGLDDRNTDDTGAFYGIKDGGWKGDNPIAFTNLLDISKAEVKTDGTVSGVIGACGGAISKWSNLLSGSSNCDGWAMYFGERGTGGESTDYTGTALKYKGEKMFTKPFILGGLVTWTTFIPGTDECTKDGESNVYAVYFETGTAYKQYVFSDQVTDPVGRVKNIGPGMASTVSGQETKDGKTKGIIKQSNGTIIEIENVAPVSRKSKIMGWSNKPIQ